ncbi:MAG: hypothetical protein J3K34DRAFT_473044 [Monoraphidium minutum]|nr:MAG: hypothetical protein J3K34DRAFT_473044 [Monoraphidium minutum]
MRTELVASRTVRAACLVPCGVAAPQRKRSQQQRTPAAHRRRGRAAPWVAAAQQQQGGGSSSGSSSSSQDSDLAFVAKGLALSFAVGAAIKWGSLLVPLPHEPNAAVALTLVLGTPLAYGALLLAGGPPRGK